MSFWQKSPKKGNLIFEVEKNFSRVLFFASSNGNFSLERKILQKGEPRKSLPLLFREIFLKEKKFFPEKIVFSLSDSFSYCFFDRRTLLFSKEIFFQEKELENFLQRAERDLYEKYRKQASWQMNCSLSDLDFSFVWIDKIFVNDHLLRSPIGFRGKSLSFLLGNVLVEKNLLGFIKSKLNFFLERFFSEPKKDNFSWPEIFFLNRETPLIFLLSFFSFSKYLSSRLSKEGFVFLEVYPKKTGLSYFSPFFGASQFLFVDEGFLNLFLEQARDKLLFDRESALKFIELFSKNNLSSKWNEAFKKINQSVGENFLDIFLYLFRRVGCLPKKEKAVRVFIYGNGGDWLDLPLFLKKTLKAKENGKPSFSFHCFPLKEIERETGISIKNLEENSEEKLLSFAINAFPVFWLEKIEISQYLWQAIRKIY